VKAASGAQPSLTRATLTLLGGGALAQLLPLLLGPFIARLFTPEAFGLYTQFATVAAALAVVASLRYEQALPLARSDDEARALLALALRLLLAAVLLGVPLGWALHALGALPLAVLLAPALATAGLLQVLMLWANRAQRFGALATSRVLHYGGAAALQLALGWALWRGAASGAEGAWALALAPLLAQLLACGGLWRPAPAGGWRALLVPASAALRTQMRTVARQQRDFALINTPHALLGLLQDALAVALLVAWSGEAAAGFWGLALRYLKAPATLVGGAVSQALYPRLAAARADDAVTWRTSPRRKSPVTSGGGPPIADASAAARSSTVRGCPDATLREPTWGCSTVSAATLAALTSRTCTKSRRWPPSSNTRGASPRSRAERKIAATPEYGVSRGILGP